MTVTIHKANKTHTLSPEKQGARHPDPSPSTAPPSARQAPTSLHPILHPTLHPPSLLPNPIRPCDLHPSASAARLTAPSSLRSPIPCRLSRRWTPPQRGRGLDERYHLAGSKRRRGHTFSLPNIVVSQACQGGKGGSQVGDRARVEAEGADVAQGANRAVEHPSQAWKGGRPSSSLATCAPPGPGHLISPHLLPFIPVIARTQPSRLRCKFGPNEPPAQPPSNALHRTRQQPDFVVEWRCLPPSQWLPGRPTEPGPSLPNYSPSPARLALFIPETGLNACGYFPPCTAPSRPVWSTLTLELPNLTCAYS